MSGFSWATPWRKKPSCCFTISLHDLDDGPGALVERLHQPVGAGQAFAEPGLGAAVGAAGQLGIIAAVDEQARQGRAVQLDRPAEAAAGDEDVGHDRLDPARRRRSGSRAWDRRREARGSCRRDPRRRLRRCASAPRNCPWRDSRDCRSAAPSPDRSGRPPSPGARGIRRGCGRRSRSGSKVWTTARTRSTSASGTPSRLARSRSRGEEIAGLVDLLDDLAGDDEVGARQALAGLGEEMLVERDVVGGEAVEIGALAVAAAAADSPSMPRPPSRPRRSEALSWWKFSSLTSRSSGAVAADAERRPAAGGSSRSLGRRLGRRGAVLAGAAPRAAGCVSISSAMKLSTSRLDSASSRIACWSCGVITSDWLCRRSRRGPSAMACLQARSSRRDRGGGRSRRRPAPPGCRRTAPGRRR